MFCRHFLLCLYGAIAIGLVLAGRLKELKVVYILTGKDDFPFKSSSCWTSAYESHCGLPLFIIFCSVLWHRKFFFQLSTTCCTGDNCDFLCSCLFNLRFVFWSMSKNSCFWTLLLRIAFCNVMGKFWTFSNDVFLVNSSIKIWEIILLLFQEKCGIFYFKLNFWGEWEDLLNLCEKPIHPPCRCGEYLLLGWPFVMLMLVYVHWSVRWCHNCCFRSQCIDI